MLVAYLFGSRAEGRAAPQSDYDIAVLARARLMPARRFELARELGRLLNARPVERNLEVAAQCCIDMANRIIALENAPRPTDYDESLLRLGEIGVLPLEFAQRIAPLGGFRNILVHE